MIVACEREYKVASLRMLSRLRGAGWPKELLDMMYLDEDLLAHAYR
jgi:protein PhnA